MLRPSMDLKNLHGDDGNFERGYVAHHASDHGHEVGPMKLLGPNIIIDQLEYKRSLFIIKFASLLTINNFILSRHDYTPKRLHKQ